MLSPPHARRPSTLAVNVTPLFHDDTCFKRSISINTQRSGLILGTLERWGVARSPRQTEGRFTRRMKLSHSHATVSKPEEGQCLGHMDFFFSVSFSMFMMLHSFFSLFFTFPLFFISFGFPFYYCLCGQLNSRALNFNFSFCFSSLGLHLYETEQS